MNVDEQMPQISLEQVAAFYGVLLSDLKRIGSETRTACFLNCGKTDRTDDRALAIQESDPIKKWKCHQYGCTKGGNLVSLCDLMKPGADASGRPRGERFKEIAADLRAMVHGVPSPAGCPAVAPEPAPPPPPAEVKFNVSLKDSSRYFIRYYLRDETHAIQAPVARLDPLTTRLPDVLPRTPQERALPIDNPIRPTCASCRQHPPRLALRPYLLARLLAPTS